jgi:hypothetical protein
VKKPFSRIPDVVTEPIVDNWYQGDESDFAYQAHLKVGFVSGKSFRTEKNKRKKANYAFGQVVEGTRSFKFEDSD